MTVAETPAERRGLLRLVPGHHLVALLLPHHLLRGGREGGGIKREGAIEGERKGGKEGRREGRREGRN